jgi:hypothetical protein
MTKHERMRAGGWWEDCSFTIPAPLATSLRRQGTGFLLKNSGFNTAVGHQPHESDNRIDTNRYHGLNERDGSTEHINERRDLPFQIRSDRLAQLRSQAVRNHDRDQGRDDAVAKRFQSLFLHERQYRP